MNINFNQQCGHGYVVIDEYPCPGRQHGFHDSMNGCPNHGFGNTYVVIDEYHDSNHAGFYNRRYNNRQWHPQFNARRPPLLSSPRNRGGPPGPRWRGNERRPFFLRRNCRRPPFVFWTPQVRSPLAQQPFLQGPQAQSQIRPESTRSPPRTLKNVSLESSSQTSQQAAATEPRVMVTEPTEGALATDQRQLSSKEPTQFAKDRSLLTLMTEPQQTSWKAPPQTSKKAQLQTSTKIPPQTSRKTPPKMSTKTPPETLTKTPPSMSTKTPPQTSTKTPPKMSTQTPPRTPPKTPAQTSTKTPAQTSTKTPAQTSTKTPAQASTKALPQTSWKTREQISFKAPEQTSTKAPEQTSTKAPEQTSTKAPEPTSTKASEQTSTEALEKVSTKTPQQISAKAPQQISAKAPLQTSTKIPTQVSTKNSPLTTKETVPQKTDVPTKTSKMTMQKTEVLPQTSTGVPLVTPAKKEQQIAMRMSLKETSTSQVKVSLQGTEPTPTAALQGMTMSSSFQTPAKVPQYAAPMLLQKPTKMTQQGMPINATQQGIAKIIQKSAAEVLEHRTSLNVSLQSTWLAGAKTPVQATKTGLSTAVMTSQLSPSKQPTTNTPQRPTTNAGQSTAEPTPEDSSETSMNQASLEVQQKTPVRASLEVLRTTSVQQHFAQQLCSSEERLASQELSSRGLKRKFSSVVADAKLDETSAKTPVVARIVSMMHWTPCATGGYESPIICDTPMKGEGFSSTGTRTEIPPVPIGAVKEGVVNCFADSGDNSFATIYSKTLSAHNEGGASPSIATTKPASEVLQWAVSTARVSVDRVRSPDGNIEVSHQRSHPFRAYSSSLDYLDWSRAFDREITSSTKAGASTAAQIASATACDAVGYVKDNGEEDSLPDEPATGESDQETASVASTVIVLSDYDDDDLFIVSENNSKPRDRVNKMKTSMCSKEQRKDQANRSIRGKQTKKDRRVELDAPSCHLVTDAVIGNVLFELNTYTACCVLDMCEDSEAKQKVLQLYTEGKQAIGKTAYDLEIQRTVAKAVENKRISWKGASGTLRKLAKIQWSVPSVQTDALPIKFYLQKMQDELIKAATTGS
ncbi:hypothetical protein ISCGN_005199 [Ixodes scapularis]